MELKDVKKKIKTGELTLSHGNICVGFVKFIKCGTCHAIDCDNFIAFSRGFAGFVTRANPSCQRAKGGYSLDKSPAHQEQFGVQYLAQDLNQ